MPSSVPLEKNPASRTLILAPPSVSSKQDVLEAVFENHERATTDLQMLDRLAAGMISLPTETYELVLLLSEPEGSEGETAQFVKQDVMLKLVQSMRPGARIRRQNGAFGAVTMERTEALLAGLLDDGMGGMVRPSFADTSAVPLGKRAKKDFGAGGDLNGGSAAATTNVNGKRDIAPTTTTTTTTTTATAPTAAAATAVKNGKVNGVGFVDFSDDLEAELITGEDDELIDEDLLLTEADLARPVIQRKSVLLFSFRLFFCFKTVEKFS